MCVGVGVGEILISNIVIVKFSDWQVMIGNGLCLSVEWGRYRWAGGQRAHGAG